MTLREEIVEKVNKMPESSLPELLHKIEELESKQYKPSLMEQLRKIKIQAPPDFSRNIDLYLSGEKDFDENLK